MHQPDVRHTVISVEALPAESNNTAEDPGIGYSLRDRSRSALNGLAETDLEQLERHARLRLLRVGLSPSDAGDLVQDALLAILRGIDSPCEGRHPRLQDLSGPLEFSGYLKGVIGSLVEARSRGRRSHNDEVGAVECAAPCEVEPDRHLEASDLAEHLFRGIGARAPAHLQSIVKSWAAEWHTSDRIPLCGKPRRCRAEVRRLAVKVLLESINSPNPV